MTVVRLAHETDFAGWREAARALRRAGTAPDQVIWTVDGGADLLAAQPATQAAAGPTPALTVPRGFLDLAQRVVLHRSDERFALLYRLLWRLQDQPELLRVVTDADVARAGDMVRAVDRAAHKMKAYVRFRETVDADGEVYVAWFEPAHRVVEATAPFFVRRFAAMRFSILTPDLCAHWDTRDLRFTPGADPAEAPGEDALEDAWRAYYASTFNPARLKTAAMQREMPKMYWRNLPEARLIPELVANAEARTHQMVRLPATQPTRRIAGGPTRDAGAAPPEGQAPETLAQVAAGVDVCRRCDLWRDATQGVPGEGPSKARLMFVGEQPGDQEDLAGHPFVGPAGQMLDRALAAAGVPRAETYVTNAVKHFKHEPRGKRRIHKTPNAGEVTACRWWLDAERRLVRPRVIVAMGGTAIGAVFGKALPVTKFRQQAIQLPDQAQGVVTYHPSYLLRLPDAAAKKAAYELFVEDLKFAWALTA